jgi:hypothetical protein
VSALEMSLILVVTALAMTILEGVNGDWAGN